MSGNCVQAHASCTRRSPPPPPPTERLYLVHVELPRQKLWSMSCTRSQFASCANSMISLHVVVLAQLYLQPARTGNPAVPLQQVLSIGTSPAPTSRSYRKLLPFLLRPTQRGPSIGTRLVLRCVLSRKC